MKCNLLSEWSIRRYFFFVVHFEIARNCFEYSNLYLLFSYLQIAEAKAIVVGPTDIYVKMGSEVLLTCIVSQGPHELGSIFWYRGKQVLLFFFL